MTHKSFELRYLICAPATLALLVQFIILIWLEKRIKPLYYVYGIPFVIQDVIYNVVAGTLMFLEPPREWMFTTRLKRLDREGRSGRLLHSVQARSQ